MRDSKILLRDILEAIMAIEKFVSGINFEEFINNDEKTSAVIRKFEIMGEAAKSIPSEIKEKYPEIPWKEMAAFRDKLIHFYFGIKHDLVWHTIKNRLPQIKSLLQKILEGKNI